MIDYWMAGLSRRVVAGAILVGGMALLAAPASAPSAAELLTRMDRSRNGWDSFVVEVKITNYLRGAVDRSSRYQVFIKGDNKSLVKFLEPEDRGKYLLTVDELMWFYLMSASRPIRVTPLQRLSGNASNGDVAQMNLAQNYTPVSLKEELLDAAPVYVMDLEAKDSNATYQKMTYWIARDTTLPVKAEFRLASGKASKRALFVEYQKVDGRMLLRRQEIYDQLRNDEKTVLEYQKYERRDLPDKLFNKNYRQEL